jgi:hypothetical protein
VLGFFLDPLIAADGGDAKDIEFLGLQEDQDGLLIAGAGAAGILIDDDFDFVLRGGNRGAREKNRRKQEAKKNRLTEVPVSRGNLE